MLKRLSKYTRFVQARTAVLIVLMSFAWPTANADDGSDRAVLADQLGTVFHRSMSHWKFDYTKMPDRKAGVACIPWKRLDTAFLDSAVFEAIGFSYSMYDDEGAINVATQGCNQMKGNFKLSDCECEVVLLGETVAVTVPKEASK